MTQEKNHIGEVNKMVEHHIVDTNKMITPVEWFYQRILAKDIKKVFEQAKAMEKSTIMAAYMRGNADTTKLINLELVTIAEEYYNETYNK